MAFLVLQQNTEGGPLDLTNGRRPDCARSPHTCDGLPCRPSRPVPRGPLHLGCDPRCFLTAGCHSPLMRAWGRRVQGRNQSRLMMYSMGSLMMPPAMLTAGPHYLAGIAQASTPPRPARPHGEGVWQHGTSSKLGEICWSHGRALQPPVREQGREAHPPASDRAPPALLARVRLADGHGPSCLRA